MLNSDIPGWISTFHAQATAAALSVTRDLPRSSPTHRPRTPSPSPRPVRIRIGSRDFRWSEARNPIQIPIPDAIGDPTFGDRSAAQRHKVLIILTLVILTLIDRVLILALVDRALVFTLVILTLIDRVLVLALVIKLSSESKQLFPHQLHLLTTTKCTPNDVFDSSKFRLCRACIFYRP
ncbi:hypothetical protein CFAM422_009656 [Trichoderma lentiforme]|uniref:Uncharacterized protein n=1 Tax=Trichoderma lentiforme TaxID=1567552 RepID=A0A9P5CA75_9HYPO|nr:hypothetical protein CFAM422_009656 [Trichoderma lentiforme]